MKKLFTVLLSSVMALSLLPTMAFATGGDVNASAQVVGAWHKAENFKTNGVVGAVEGTDTPELQLTITDAAYTQSSISTAQVKIDLMFDNATLTSGVSASDLENRLKIVDKSKNDLFTTSRNGTTLSVLVTNITEEGYTITINGALEKDDLISIPLQSVMTRTSLGKLATVSVVSDLGNMDDLMYCATAAYGVLVSIGDSVKVAQGEAVTLSKKGLTIQPLIENSYSAKAKFELQLNSGFTFTDKNKSLTIMDEDGTTRTILASNDEIEVTNQKLTIYPKTTKKFTVIGIEIEATTAKVGAKASISIVVKDTKSTGTVNVSYSTLLETSVGNVTDSVTETTTPDDTTTPAFTTKVIVPIGANAITAGEEEIALDVPAYISGGYTMLPVRAVAKALGIDNDNVTWDSATKTVTIIYDKTTIKMMAGSRTIIVNDEASLSSSAVEITDGRTFLPLRDLANALGVTTIDWDSTTKTATLN